MDKPSNPPDVGTDRWTRPDHVEGLPALPVEFKASRAEFHDEFGINLFAVFCAVPLFALLVAKLTPLGQLSLPPAVSGTIEILVLPGLVAGAFGLTALKRRHHRRVRDLTSVTLSADGIEYRGPATHCRLGWTEIEAVTNESIPIHEDVSLEAIAIRAGRCRFRLSACYFTEAEVSQMAGLIKRWCPAARDDPRFRAV